MNRTVKVTGFSLKPAIRHQLGDLFSRVAQVQKVSLSQDRNSALVRFEYRSAVQFVLEQDWLLGSDILRVRPVVPPRDSQPQQTAEPQHKRCLTPDHQEPHYTFSYYCRNRNQFWLDVPHEQFAVPCSRKKRRRRFDAERQSFPGPSKKPKHKKKRQKKIKCAYLEPTVSLPFGLTSVPVQCPLDAATVSEPRNESCLKEVFIKGDKTATASLPQSSTAAEVRHLVAEMTKVPAELLHITVGGRTLTDEVVSGIVTGSTLHYTIKGRGGMHSGEDGGGKLGLANPKDTLQRKEEKFQRLKEVGNSLVKQDKFGEAIGPYTQCLYIFKDRAAIFTNRALCYLKLDKAREAEEDCSMALHLEPKNVKALYRRGLARKMQGKYKQSWQDQIDVLRTEPSNNVAKKECELLKELCKQERSKTGSHPMETARRNVKGKLEAGKESVPKTQRVISPLVTVLDTRRRGTGNKSHQLTAQTGTKALQNIAERKTPQREVTSVKSSQAARALQREAQPTVTGQQGRGTTTDTPWQETLHTANVTLQKTPQPDYVIPQETPQTVNTTPQETPQTADTTPQETPQTADTTPQETPQTADTPPQETPQTADTTPQKTPQTADASPQETPQTADATPQGTPQTADATPQETPQTADATPQETPQTADATPQETPQTADATPQETPQTADATPQDTPQTADATPQETPQTADATPQETPQTADDTSEMRISSIWGKHVISREARVEAVQGWLAQTCGLSDEDLAELDVMDGKTLFSYSAFEDLIEDIGLQYGVARKILFLRDFEGKAVKMSTMMQWSVNEVICFVRESLEKPDLDLELFEQKKIDGPVFMSFCDPGELKRDLGLKGLHARRVFEERNEFLKAEEATFSAGADCNSVNVSKVLDDHLAAGNKNASALLPDSVEMNKQEVEGYGLLPDFKGAGKHTGSHGDQAQSPLELHDEPQIECLEGNPEDLHKLFAQNRIHLQPLKIPSNIKVKSLRQAFLKIIQVAEENPSILDQSFVFCVACGTEFPKEGLRFVWRSVKSHMHDLWIHKLPSHLQDKLKIENTTVMHDGKELAFSTIPTPSQVGLAEFEKKGSAFGDSAHSWILLVDKKLLKENALGYSCKLGNMKNSPQYHFGFEKDRKYFVFDIDISQSSCTLELTEIEDNQRGTLGRCFFQCKEGSPAVRREGSTSTQTTSCADSKEQNPRTKSKTGSKAVVHNSKAATMEAGTVLKKARPGKRLPLVHPRKFKQDPKRCKYDKGQLDVHETADGMMLPSVELKYYEVEDAEIQIVFLLKSLKFVCGCLNSRKNGTIYFGVPEGDVQDKQFDYGEIDGIALDESGRGKYYTSFHKYLEKCFPQQKELVKRCVYGPYFVRIRTFNGEAERYVIELDVEPSAVVCGEYHFVFDPSHIDKKRKGQKGVYVRDIESGTVQTRRLSPEDLKKYLQNDLPSFVKQRETEEKHWTESHQLKTKSEARSLKAFMKECVEAVDPILVVSKPTEDVKQNIEACLKFVTHIPWAAVFDFDNESLGENGLLHLHSSSPCDKKAVKIPIKSFVKKKVKKQKEELNMSLQTAWFLANGSCGESDFAFDHLEQREWLVEYYPFVRNAVTFLQNSYVMSECGLILILVSAEMEGDIIRTVDDIASDPDIGLDSVYFVFDEERTQELFVSKSLFGEGVKKRSSVLPWQDVQRIITEVLPSEKKPGHKLVVTASGSLAEIPSHQWMKWTDLSVLSANECEDTDMTLEQSKASEEETRFYRGGQVSWLNFYFPNQVMKRSNMDAIVEEIFALAQTDCTDIPKVTIHHMPGTGGTTLAKHLLWNMRKSFKCAVIERITHDTFSQICDFWESGELTERCKWKPLILVSDNNTTEESEIGESDLCDKVHRRQKQDRLCRPVAIFIMCHRTAVTVRHGVVGYSLKQQLIDATERMWMKNTHKRLEDKIVERVINSFLGFLCMRHEFKASKLQTIITPYLYDETLRAKDKELIVYIALIVKYFPASLGCPGIPVSSCDMFMDYVKHTWDKKVFGIADEILVREYNSVIRKKIVKIANKAVADVILSMVMKKEELTLPDLVQDCLNSSLVADLDECEHDSSSWTVKILRSMLIERLTETGSKRHMSQLILDIQKHYTLEEAVAVLELGYQRLGGEVFYQQLARLYTKEVQFEKAVACAKKAVDLSRTDNEEFSHTLGFVYLRYFEHLKKLKDDAPLELEHHRTELDKAVKSFNSLTNAQNSADAITKSYACCDKIKVINSLLDYIIYKVLPPKDYKIFGRFLTAERYEIQTFDDYTELKDILKEILDAAVESLKYMFYFGFSYKHRGRGEFTIKDRSKFPVAYTKGECMRQFKTLASTVKVVVFAPDHHDTELPLEICLKKYRTENLKLTGSFFESILNFVAVYNQKVRKQARCRENLKMVKANLDRIIGGTGITLEDMDNYITVCLAMELLKIEQNFTVQRSQIYEYCNKIISARDGDEARTMRAHLYRVLICWPTWKKCEMFSIQHFLVSFHNRPTFLACREGALTPRVHFFIAKSASCFHLCHWTEIFELEPKKKIDHTVYHPFEEADEEEEEKDEEEEADDKVTVAMHQKLKSFRGNYTATRSEDGTKYYSFVELDMALYSKKLPKKVTIRAMKGEKISWDATVDFYLGFSLQGPVAYVYSTVE